jgi:dihydrofolate synthase/folylpolyglutamate synthase
VVALRAAELLTFGADAIAEGLRNVRSLAGVHGRFEVLQTEPLIVADAAHNPAGLASALQTVQSAAEARGGRLTVALGGVRDKDVGAMARLIAEVGVPLIPLAFESPRSMPADEVAAQAAEAGASVEPPRTIDEALAHFRRTAEPDDVLLLTGSHGVVIPLLAAQDGT